MAEFVEVAGSTAAGERNFRCGRGQGDCPLQRGRNRLRNRRRLFACSSVFGKRLCIPRCPQLRVLQLAYIISPPPARSRLPKADLARYLLGPRRLSKPS
jgi:hypothetical protein